MTKEIQLYEEVKQIADVLWEYVTDFEMYFHNDDICSMKISYSIPVSEIQLDRDRIMKFCDCCEVGRDAAPARGVHGSPIGFCQSSHYDITIYPKQEYFNLFEKYSIKRYYQ